MKIPGLLKFLWLPLLVSRSVLVVVAILWQLQQQNVRYLGSQIDTLQGKIDDLQKTVTQMMQMQRCS